MRKELRDMFGRHKGSPALIVGHGPSLNAFVGRLPEYRSKGVIIFGCNEWYRIYSDIPDYIVYASTVDTLSHNKELLNSYVGKTTVLYADSVDLVNRSWVEDNIKCDYIPYDQKHFDNKPCGGGICCPMIIPGRLTIQEELRKFTGHGKIYSAGSSVALHMTAAAVLFGCNPVYVVGVELDYRVGYATNSGNISSKVRPIDFDDYRTDIIKDFVTIKESAERVGTSIYNMNSLSTFKDIEIKELCV